MRTKTMLALAGLLSLAGAACAENLVPEGKRDIDVPFKFGGTVAHFWRDCPRGFDMLRLYFLP